MNTKTYAFMLEKKLTTEFKEKFCEKLGYYPIVVTNVTTDANGNTIPILSLEDLENVFTPFLPQRGYTTISLKVKRRFREVVELRNMFCLIAKTMGYTLDKIGQYLGKRDHTTVIHNIKTCKILLENNAPFQETYKKIIKLIKETYEPATLELTDQV
jgi:hypothetical protein